MKIEPRILLVEASGPGIVERLQAVGQVVVLAAADEATLCAGIAEADALIVRTRTQVTRRVIEAAVRLKVIGRAGSGLDNIDLAAARERGVKVVCTPAASTDAVADLTVGLMIALLRRIVDGDSGVRSGAFAEARNRCIGPEMRDLTLGVIGMGRIGRAVARRCHLGFGMRVVYNDIVEIAPLDVPAVAIEKPELYSRADVVSLHVPLTDQTRGLIDADALRCFRKEAALVNTARGAVVDSVALAAALGEGRLAGAALDVTDPEPLPPDHPLLSAPNTLLTPHVGARTPASLARMDDVVEDVVAVLKGRTPRFAAEPDDVG